MAFSLAELLTLVLASVSACPPTAAPGSPCSSPPSRIRPVLFSHRLPSTASAGRGSISELQPLVEWSKPTLGGAAPSIPANPLPASATLRKRSSRLARRSLPVLSFIRTPASAGASPGMVVSGGFLLVAAHQSGVDQHLCRHEQSNFALTVKEKHLARRWQCALPCVVDGSCCRLVTYAAGGAATYAAGAAATYAGAGAATSTIAAIRTRADSALVLLMTTARSLLATPSAPPPTSAPPQQHRSPLPPAPWVPVVPLIAVEILFIFVRSQLPLSVLIAALLSLDYFAPNLAALAGCVGYVYLRTRAGTLPLAQL